LFAGLKKNVAPPFNIILNGEEKVKVSVIGPEDVLVATKVWKASSPTPPSPSFGSLIKIDTASVVSAEVGGNAYPETCSMIRRKPAGTWQGTGGKPPTSSIPHRLWFMMLT